MINTVKSALSVSTHKIGVLSNNIANAGTTAFKRSEATFRDVYLTGGGMANLSIGQGSLVHTNRSSHNPAELEKTGMSSDVAVNGHGMFILGSIDGDGSLRYSRNGSFQIDRNGLLTANDGSPVLTKELQTITVPSEVNGSPLTEFNISQEGDVRGTYGLKTPIDLGRIGLASFDNPSELNQIGDGYYVSNAEAGLYGLFDAKDGGTGTLLSGHLEVANVDISEELIGLISAQQAFSAASKALQADSDMVARFTR